MNDLRVGGQRAAVGEIDALEHDFLVGGTGDESAAGVAAGGADMNHGVGARLLEVQVVAQVAAGLAFALKQVVQVEYVATVDGAGRVEVGDGIDGRLGGGDGIGKAPLEGVGAEAAGQGVVAGSTCDQVGTAASAAAAVASRAGSSGRW